MSRKQIVLGPYLLSPSATGITVAWEMRQAESLSLSYEADGERRQVKAVREKEPARKEQPEGEYLYTAILDHLAPDTTYSYAIQCGGETLATSAFRTQKEHPEHLHLVTLSDSHLFYNGEQFGKMVEHVQPDFLLHSGDISFGTGFQHDQYTDNWFHKIPEVLASIPAWYIPGNHDDGPFDEALLLSPQAKTTNSPDGGFTYSFDVGRVHFTMVDSNPWGLFEMNAVNSSAEPDEKTRRQVRETLAWIEQDLLSPQAKAADWRILVAHHPYTDVFNNRYLVPIAERCGVNLVIGGHLHYYIQAVSVNPSVGARTMYVCQGSAQDPEAKFQGRLEGKRLLSEFPEVTALGRNNYGVLDITKDAIDYKLYGFTDDGKEQLVDTIHMTHDAPDVALSDIELRRVDNNGNIEVRAFAENRGTSPATVVLPIVDNGKLTEQNLFGQKADSHVALLQAGEKRKLIAYYQAYGAGNHHITLEDAALDLIVYEPQQLSYAHMRVFAGKGKDADCLIASIEATNNLDQEVFSSVPLYIDQRIAEARNIFFRSHERRHIEFRHRFAKGGDYQVSIGDQLPKNITIAAGIRIVPRILDRSGHGHYGLLQGSPKVVQEHGKTVVKLEHYGDYIEIPASPDLVAEQGFTGIVWAKVNRLAKPSEMGHNPLMVRGKSVGWGATYYLRMVIERAGGLKWGTCHDITEYMWQGGEAAVGSWMQYVSTFDKQAGGSSYCDAKEVARVPGIAPECKLRQWQEEPIFVGYSYIGHVIPELGRPKYFTHLPGDVREVRFYKQGLAADEVRETYDHPEEAGAREKDLAVWLDFKNILTVGTHTTEWRHPTVYSRDYMTQKKYWTFRQLKVIARVPLQTSLKATVEVSDDEASIKGKKEIRLQDGTQYIDLQDLPEAQYLRIRTEFSADVGPDGTFVPELLLYQVTAATEKNFTEMYWSTRTAWEKGTFTGAVGFAPFERLKDFPEYTDVIHG